MDDEILTEGEATGGEPTGGEATGGRRQGWIIFCPEENSQLGDPFWNSEEAFKLANAHNKAERHNATIQPYWE